MNFGEEAGLDVGVFSLPSGLRGEDEWPIMPLLEGMSLSLSRLLRSLIPGLLREGVLDLELPLDERLSVLRRLSDLFRTFVCFS